MKAPLPGNTWGESPFPGMLRTLVHYGLHFLLPVLVGVFGFPGRGLWAVLIHILADATDCLLLRLGL